MPFQSSTAWDTGHRIEGKIMYKQDLGPFPLWEFLFLSFVVPLGLRLLSLPFAWAHDWISELFPD